MPNAYDGEQLSFKLPVAHDQIVEALETEGGISSEEMRRRLIPTARTFTICFWGAT